MAIREKVDRLEEALIELARAQKRTEEELREFKNEMLEYKEWSKRQIEELRRGIEENRKNMEEFRKSMEEYKEWSKRQIEELKNMTKRMNKTSSGESLRTNLEHSLRI